VLRAVTGARQKKSAARCPQCDAVVAVGSENPWRPFCSRRCKLIDLEGWFTERHVIPGESEDWASPDGNDERSH
jgi:hypothetical protein